MSPLRAWKAETAWLRPLFRKDWMVYSKPPQTYSMSRSYRSRSVGSLRASFASISTSGKRTSAAAGSAQMRARGIQQETCQPDPRHVGAH